MGVDPGAPATMGLMFGLRPSTEDESMMTLPIMLAHS